MFNPFINNKIFNCVNGFKNHPPIGHPPAAVVAPPPLLGEALASCGVSSVQSPESDLNFASYPYQLLAPKEWLSPRSQLKSVRARVYQARFHFTQMRQDTVLAVCKLHSQINQERGHRQIVKLRLRHVQRLVQVRSFRGWWGVIRVWLSPQLPWHWQTGSGDDYCSGKAYLSGFPACSATARCPCPSPFPGFTSRFHGLAPG